jgi:hypothetical protein
MLLPKVWAVNMLSSPYCNQSMKIWAITLHVEHTSPYLEEFVLQQFLCCGTPRRVLVQTHLHHLLHVLQKKAAMKIR